MRAVIKLNRDWLTKKLADTAEEASKENSGGEWRGHHTQGDRDGQGLGEEVDEAVHREGRIDRKSLAESPSRIGLSTCR